VLVAGLSGCGESDLEVELRGEVEALTKERDAVRTNLDETTQLLTDSETALEASKASLEETRSALAATESQLGETAERLEGELAEARGRLEAAKQRSRMLVEVVDRVRAEARTELGELTADLGSATTRAASLGAALSERQAESNELLETQARLEGEKAAVAAELEETRDQLDAARQRGRMLAEVVARTRAQAKSDVADLKKDLDEAAKSIASLGSALSGQRAAGNELEKELQRTRTDLETVTGERETLRGGLRGSESRIRALEGELAIVTERLRSSGEQILGLEARLGLSVQEKRQLEDELEILSGRIAKEREVLAGEQLAIERRWDQLEKAETDFNRRAVDGHQRWMAQQAELNTSWTRLREQLEKEQQAFQAMRAAFDSEREFLLARLGRLAEERDRLRAEVNGGWTEIDALRDQLNHARSRLVELEQ
jgi:chromosome segregation ATPase